MSVPSTNLNRASKDRLFKLVFSDANNALSLVNALNGSNYTNPDDVVVVTLEDALYMGIKNDVAILLGEDLTLLEHQSTPNPNMPLRGLLYFAAEYEGILQTLGEGSARSVYGRKLVRIPAPTYYVMYNGRESAPEREVLRLSDAFSHPAPGFEWSAVVLNISAGHNAEIMSACAPLSSYAGFVALIRSLEASGTSAVEAARVAVREYADNPHIGGVLVKNRAEVEKVILSEFDEELYRKEMREYYREEAYAWARAKVEAEFASKRAEMMAEEKTKGLTEGKAEGKAEGLAEGKAEGKEESVHTFVLNLCQKGMEASQIFQLLIDGFGLSDEDAERYLAAVQ